MASMLNILGQRASQRVTDQIRADQERQAEERARHMQQLRETEYQLQEQCAIIEGWEKFEAWYFSPAVPDRTSYANRIQLIEAHLKQIHSDGTERLEARGEAVGLALERYYDVSETEGADPAFIEQVQMAALYVGDQFNAAYEGATWKP